MELAFALRQTIVPVVDMLGSHRVGYPVRRIYCIGQNYESHAREMGGMANRANPFFFTKPADSLVTDPQHFMDCNANIPMRYPSMTESYHHEVELVVALGPLADGDSSKGYQNIAAEVAHQTVYGYAIGLDMTRRDLQLMAKQNRKPWDLAKGPDDGAVVSPIIRTKDLQAKAPQLFQKTTMGVPEERNVVSTGSIYLRVNEHLRQDGNLTCMISSVNEAIACLSQYVTLAPGDLIFTGTPSGVGPVRRGDCIQAGIQGIGEISVTVT